MPKPKLYLRPLASLPPLRKALANLMAERDP